MRKITKKWLIHGSFSNLTPWGFSWAYWIGPLILCRLQSWEFSIDFLPFLVSQWRKTIIISFLKRISSDSQIKPSICWTRFCQNVWPILRLVNEYLFPRTRRICCPSRLTLHLCTIRRSIVSCRGSIPEKNWHVSSKKNVIERLREFLLAWFRLPMPNSVSTLLLNSPTVLSPSTSILSGPLHEFSSSMNSSMLKKNNLWNFTRRNRTDRKATGRVTQQVVP